MHWSWDQAWGKLQGYQGGRGGGGGRGGSLGHEVGDGGIPGAGQSPFHSFFGPQRDKFPADGDHNLDSLPTLAMSAGALGALQVRARERVRGKGGSWAVKRVQAAGCWGGRVPGVP